MKGRSRFAVAAVLLVLAGSLVFLLLGDGADETARVAADVEVAEDDATLAEVDLAADSGGRVSVPREAVDSVGAAAEAIDSSLQAAELEGPAVHLVTVFDDADPPAPIAGAAVEFWSKGGDRLAAVETDGDGRAFAPESLRDVAPYVLAGVEGWALAGLLILSLEPRGTLDVELHPTAFVGVEVVRTDGSVSPTPDFDGSGLRAFGLSEGCERLMAVTWADSRRGAHEAFDALERRALELAGLPRAFKEPSIWFPMAGAPAQKEADATFFVEFSDTEMEVSNAPLRALHDPVPGRVTLEPSAIEVGTLRVEVTGLDMATDSDGASAMSLKLEPADSGGDPMKLRWITLRPVASTGVDGEAVCFEAIHLPSKKYEARLSFEPSGDAGVSCNVTVGRSETVVRFNLDPSASLVLDGFVPESAHLRFEAVELLQIETQRARLEQVEARTGTVARIAPGRYLGVAHAAAGYVGYDLFIATPQPPGALRVLALDEKDPDVVLERLLEALRNGDDPALVTLVETLAVSVEAGETGQLFASGLFGTANDG